MISVRVLEQTLGGEACSWSEQSDGVVLGDLFRRIPAVMERLWSNKSFTDAFKKGTVAEYTTTLRLARFLCTSLRKRDIRVGPVLPDYCPYPRERELHRGDDDFNAESSGQIVSDEFRDEWYSVIVFLNCLFCLFVLWFC